MHEGTIGRMSPSATDQFPVTRPVVRYTDRVLLTRGLRGCYVYFMNAPTRDFFLSRVERPCNQLTRAAEQAGDYR